VPSQDFSFAADHDIATENFEGFFAECCFEGEVELFEASENEPDGGWLQGGGEAESWQQLCLGGMKQCESTAAHACGRPYAAGAEHEDSSGEHIKRGVITAGATDGDESAAHAASGFVSGRPVNQQGSTGHSFGAAHIDTARGSTGRTFNTNQAASHFSPGPIAGVAVDKQFTAIHSASGVATGSPGDSDTAGFHTGADPVYLSMIAGEFDFGVGCRTGDMKQFAEGQQSVSAEDWQPLDFGE
jgi:hypothetical protein